MTDRKTKIIATIGPATNNPDMIRALASAGMNVARINMSHANHDQVREIVRTIRDVSSSMDHPIAILMDTQGPAIRTGDLANSLDLKEGDRIALTVRGEVSEEEYSVDVNYDDLVETISEGDVVLVDNGEIQLSVLSKKKNQLTCEVLTRGVLGSRRHINLPGVRVNLPALTEKDHADVELGIELQVDLFAMSFVRDDEDVTRLRAILDYRKAPQKIIAKLEDQEGIRNLDDIIQAADGVMVARGDLGIECPYEELPIIQRRIVKHCIRLGKPVVVATHMLESMIESPSPTRAEITDVANAVFEQADAIMLSGETSVGQYPVRCIEIMDKVARRTERSGGADFHKDAVMINRHARMVKAACSLAEESEASAIIVFTEKGNMARFAAWMRQTTPIYAFTNNPILINQLAILRGVTPYFLEFKEDTSLNVQAAMKALSGRSIIKTGDAVVTVCEIDVRGKSVDSVQLETVD